MHFRRFRRSETDFGNSSSSPSAVPTRPITPGTPGTSSPGTPNINTQNMNTPNLQNTSSWSNSVFCNQNQGPGSHTVSHSSSSISLFSAQQSFQSTSDLLHYNEFHDSNTVDAQLGPRLRALQDSLQNPELSPSVRKILQTAYQQFERESARNSEVLPLYTTDIPPPYQRD